MRGVALALAVALPFSGAGVEPQVAAAVQALRSDSSLKVRTQAAIVLGQRGALQAVPALREAVTSDGSAAVRLAAVSALGRLRDRTARPTLRAAADSDPDASVRAAAAKALGDLGPLSFSIDQAPGADGPAAGALRMAIAKSLRERGFAVGEDGAMRLKASVMRLDVGAEEGKTVIAVKASLVAIDGDGRMAAMLEGGARLSARGAIPETKMAAFSTRALEAAANTLCEDLAAKLGER